MAKNKKKNKFLSLFIEEVDDYGPSNRNYDDDYDDYDYEEDYYDNSYNSNQSYTSYSNNNQNYNNPYQSSEKSYSDDNNQSNDEYYEDEYYDDEYEEENPKGLFGKIKAKVKSWDEEDEEEHPEDYYEDEYIDDDKKGFLSNLKSKFKKDDDDDDEYSDEYYDEEFDDDENKGFFSRLISKFKKNDDDEEYEDDYENNYDNSSDSEQKEPLQHLFNDEDLEYSEEQDLLDADKLVWNDGEHVVSGDDLFSKQDSKHSSYHKVDEIPDDLEAPEEAELPDEDDEEESFPAEKYSGRTRIYRPDGKTVAVHLPTDKDESEETSSDDESDTDTITLDLEKQREEEHKKKVRKKKITNFFKNMSINVLFAIFLFICLIAALYYTFLLSDIIVTGNDQYTTDYIVDLSGLKLGEHVFFMDLDEAKSNIQSNPYLNVTDITYIFPSRVRINVEERKEAAGIVGLDYNVLIDKNGYVLSMSGSTDISDLLEVTGIGLTGIKLGERIGETSDFATATLISIMEKLEQYELTSYIKSLDLTTPLAIVMYTHNGFKIFIGQPTDLDKKFTSLQKLLPKFNAAGISTGTLYLSAKGGTVYSPISNPTNTETTTTEEQITEGTEVTEGTEITENGSVIADPTAGEILSPSPEPTATPVPIQPGGGDDFQG